MLGDLYGLLLRWRTPDPFSDIRPRHERRARLMRRPAPQRRYAVVFTPRSGSSRLTDLADSSGVLGRPGEVFNPAFLPRMAQALGARDLAEFVTLLGRRFNGQGTFGCEVTYAHLVRTFGDEARFLDLVQPGSLVWLIRKDIVAQAVSVSRMVQTGVSHAPGASAGDIARADRAFVYRPRQIASVLWRLRWMETSTEAMFARYGLRPLRLSYEAVSQAPATAVLGRIAAHVGADAVPPDPFESAHTKIAGPRNAEFAARFAAEHPRLAARLARRRAGMLARLDSV
jgi:LPS sulfotransferase NodH